MQTSIAKDSAKLSFSRIITTMISMVTAMLLSRFRTLEEYGTYSQILLVINLANALFMLGLPNSINYFLAKIEDKEERVKFLSAYYSISTILSFISGVALLFSLPLISAYFKNPVIKSFFYVLAIYPWTQIIMASIDNILIIYHKTTELLKFRITHSIFLLLLIVIVKYFDWNFKIYMYLLIAGEIVFTISVYFIANNLEEKMKFYIDFKIIQKILKFSIPIGLASVVGTLHIEFDKLFIGKFFNTEQLAIFTNASKEMPVSIIAGSISAVLLPQMVRLLKVGRKKEGIQIWGDSIVLSYIFICFLAIGLCVYASDAITLLYSEKYTSGTNVFRIYSIILLLKCTYFGTILNSVGKTKMIFNSSIIALGLNIVLNFVFYLFLGFEGPAIATLITTVAVALFQLIASSKAIEISLKDIFPWKELLKITVINIGFGIVFLWIKNIVPLDLYVGNLSEALILAFVWGILYLLLMYRKIKEKWDGLN